MTYEARSPRILFITWFSAIESYGQLAPAGPLQTGPCFSQANWHMVGKWSRTHGYPIATLPIGHTYTTSTVVVQGPRHQILPACLVNRSGHLIQWPNHLMIQRRRPCGMLSQMGPQVAIGSLRVQAELHEP